MQNGGDPQPPGGVPAMVVALLDHPDQVAALSPAAARGVLVEVAGVQQRLATVIMMLTVRLGEDGEDEEVSSSLPTEQGALTQEEAAKAYSMPLRTVRRLTRAGRIPSYVLGRNRMIRAADMDRYLARCRDQHVKVGTSLDG
jgi:excisionase family DNA binding protein